MDERAGGNKTKERRKEMKRGEQRRIWLDVRCVRLPGSTEPRKCQSHWIDGREAVHIFTVAISRRERERERPRVSQEETLHSSSVSTVGKKRKGKCYHPPRGGGGGGGGIYSSASSRLQQQQEEEEERRDSKPAATS